MSWNTILLVGCGGFLGAVARFLLSSWIAQRWPADTPWGTFWVNVSGSFLLAVLVGAWLPRTAWPVQTQLLIATGFLGAFTTFSALTWETAHLASSGFPLRAGLYAAGSLAAGLIAVGLGIWVGRLI